MNTSDESILGKKEMLAVLQRCCDALNEKRPFSTIESDYFQDVEFCSLSGKSESKTGIDTFRNIYNQWLDTLPNGKIEILEYFGDKNFIATRERYSGTKVDDDYLFLYYFENAKIKKVSMGV